MSTVYECKNQLSPTLKELYEQQMCLIEELKTEADSYLLQVWGTSKEESDNYSTLRRAHG